MKLGAVQLVQRFLAIAGFNDLLAGLRQRDVDYLPQRGRIVDCE